MRFFFLNTVIFVFLFVASAEGASFDQSGFHFTVDPIVGYEFTQVNSPSVHTRGMLIYGARFTAGHKLISGEGEYTQGTVDETFPVQDQNIKTDKKNARLGLRSMLSVTNGVDFVFRAGGQATNLKTTTTTISNSVSTTTEPALEIHPYAGTGLSVHLFHAVSATVEATYLFKSIHDWSQNDVQTSISINFKKYP